MSSEWITTKLGTLVSVNSKSLSVKSNFETIEYIDTASVTENNFDPPVLLKIKDAPSRAKRIVSTGDTIISTVRPSQKHYGYIQNCKKNTIVSTGFAVITPKNIAPSFLYYFLTQENITNYLNNVAETSTSTFPAFKPDIINEIEITLPKDIREQASIGNFLMQIDNKIRFNNKINQTLESISQTLFKSWFVDFDPVKAKIAAKEQGEDPQLAAMMAISGKSEDEINQMPADKRKQLAETADLFPDEMMESELGEIPKGWKILALYDTAEYVNGGAFKANDFSKEKLGLPIIKIAELKSGISNQTEYTLKEVQERYRINNDDILYSWSGSPETSLEVFKWFGGEGWLNQHIFKINTSSIEQKVYVYNLLRYLKPILIEIAKNKQTTGLGHVTVADMKRIKIVFPDKKASKFIKYKLIPLYNLASNCMKQNSVLAIQRDTLLPKLITGEITVNF